MIPATANNLSQDNIDLAVDISDYDHDPLEYVKYAFPWGEKNTVLEGKEGPRDWQREALIYIGNHLSNPKTRFTPCRIAVASGHGIGKSAFGAMVLKWGLSTHADTRATVTANTETQLRTKTWPELAKWHHLGLDSHWWDFQTTCMISNQPKHDKSWRVDRIAWSEHNAQAFAGLHNEGKRIILIFDEGSEIADSIYDTSEGAMTDKDTEIIWIVLGNPTLNTGRFREFFGSLKHRWKTFQVDSRSVPDTNKEQFEQWKEDFGEDSDFFRVRVRGEFPRAAPTQFIPQDTVAAARKYKAQGFEKLPKILGVDVARFGDSRTVIFYRQGRQSKLLATYRELDTEMTAQKVIEFMTQLEPDATVVDGVGVGGGVVDHIKARGYGKKLFEFQGGGRPQDPNMYFNRRTEAWGMMRDWLAAGAEIPDLPELEQELTTPNYSVSRGRKSGTIALEEKEDLKRRGFESPDMADALSMTFHVNVAPPKPKSVKKRLGSMNRKQGWMVS